MLDGLVASVLEARISDGHGARAERRDGVIADVGEPHVLDRAGAETVNAVTHVLAHDHVPNRAAVGHLEKTLAKSGFRLEISL